MDAEVKASMNVKIEAGVGLVLGGLGAAFFVAPTLDPKTGMMVRFGGLAAAVAGAFVAWNGLKDAGGLFEFGAAGVFGGEKPLVASSSLVRTYAPESLTSPLTVARPGVEDKRFVISFGGEVLEPARDGVVNPGVWADTYTMRVKLFNATPKTISSVLEVNVEEDYGDDEPERISTVASTPTVLGPGDETVETLNVKIAGGRVRFSRPLATATVKWNGREVDRVTYGIKT
jgi:hypothetical protein